jgi:hypothetical protein
MHRLYRPFQHYFRTRRMREFVELFQPSSSTRIIDIGGTAYNWTLISEEPVVVLVNRDPGVEAVPGDGRQLAYGDGAFDIAYSNSVIEHVGEARDREAFAAELRRVAPRYYVQTPNRWFIVEPHLIAVGIHYLPRAVLRRIVRWCSVWGWVERPSQPRIDEVLASIHLLDRRELQALFPDAEIRAEKWLGMTKSLIAIRR